MRALSTGLLYFLIQMMLLSTAESSPAVPSLLQGTCPGYYDCRHLLREIIGHCSGRTQSRFCSPASPLESLSHFMKPV